MPSTATCGTSCHPPKKNDGRGSSARWVRANEACVTYAILALTAAVLVLLVRVWLEGCAHREEARLRAVATGACLARLERKVDELAASIAAAEQAVRDDGRMWSTAITAAQEGHFKQLTDALRDVVHETPDYAITGEDGEVPIRRVRSLRVQLARMEEMSRLAAEGSR